MNRFENKVVVITGAAGGIGEATTRRIVSEGGKVVIADHSAKKGGTACQRTYSCRGRRAPCLFFRHRTPELQRVD